MKTVELIFEDGVEDVKIKDRSFRVLCNEKKDVCLRYFSSDIYRHVKASLQKKLEKKMADKFGDVKVDFSYCVLAADDTEDLRQEIVPQVHIYTFKVNYTDDSYGSYISQWLVTLSEEHLDAIINKLDQMLKKVEKLP